ncbi:MAG: glycosyltransferase, partial [Stellaceae bacterium]
MDRPFASILIPTYNHEQYIGPALDSVLAQTDPDWEAIVVDDGSTDRSGAIIEGYAARDSRIRAVHQPNGGVAAALNAGLRAARGDWVHWLSSDDLFDPKKLAINRRWIERNPGITFFYSYFWLLHEASGHREKHDLWGPAPEPGLQVPTLFYRNYLSGITICINRSAWNRVGCFEERYHYAQDYALWLRLLLDNEACLIPEWTVVNRHHAGQGSEQFPEACYFDTAKAGIDFLNRHSLPELIPRIDLSEPGSAAAAIERIVDIACDRSAFLYSLGPHPALILRVLEWVFDSDAGGVAAGLRGRLRGRIRLIALEEGEDDWSWMWRGLAASCAEPEPRFAYYPIDPRELARREHAARRQGRGAPAAPLRRYLRRFEGCEEPAEPPSGSSAARIVMLAPAIEPVLLAARRAAAELSERGLRTALVVAGHRYRWEAAAATVPRLPIDRDGLPWLGEIELALALDRRPAPIWLEAAVTASLDGPAVLKPALIVAEILGALRLDGSGAARRPVAFLERVLSGGGAERVVRDLARRIDHRRFRPVILTLFDARDQAGMITDVETYWVRDGRQALAPASAPSAVAAREATTRPPLGAGSWQRRGLLLAISLCQRLMPRSIDRRIGFGHRLAHVRQGLLAGVPPGHYANALWRKLRPAARPRRPMRRALPAAGMGAPTIGWDAGLPACLEAHWPAAQGLRDLLSQLGGDTALVTVMEEAAASAWLAQIGGAVPFIASLHTCESRYLPLMYPQPARLAVERWAFANACAAAARVVFPSQGCCEDLQASFGAVAGKTMAIPNPINCARVRRLSWAPLAPEDAAAIRDAPCYVHVGRLDPSKNHDLLVRACLGLRARGRDFTVLCVGEGPERRRLAGEIARHGLECHVI